MPGELLAPAISPQDFGHPHLLEDYLPVTPPITSPSICAVCHMHPAIYRCSACKNIHYCSTNCQTLDWTFHKLLCKPFVKSQALRPDPTYRRALYLPTTQAKASFVYLAYGSDGTPLDLMKCFPGVPKDEVKTIAFQNQYLPYWVQLSYDSNPSGARTLSNNSRALYAFRGPVVAIAYDLDEGLGKPALDADTTTLGPVLEYARLRAEYQGPIFVEQPQKKYTEEEWKKFMGGTQEK